MTQRAVAALPEFKRLKGALLSVSGALVEIQRMHRLKAEEIGFFTPSRVLYGSAIAHASDLLTQREAVAKLTKGEHVIVRVL